MFPIARIHVPAYTAYTDIHVPDHMRVYLRHCAHTFTRLHTNYRVCCIVVVPIQLQAPHLGRPLSRQKNDFD